MHSSVRYVKDHGPRGSRAIVHGPRYVEVVSPSNTAGEIQEKVFEYLEAGTELVWVIDPASRSVAVWRPSGDAHVYREGELLQMGNVHGGLSGVSLPVAEIFARS